MSITRVSRLRDCLIRSHVASVTIAVLLLWAIHSAFRAIWPPVSRIGGLLFTAVAILDIPYLPMSVMGRSMLLISANYMYVALVTFAAAVVISRWVYGLGPFRSLSAYQGKIVRLEKPCLSASRKP